MRLFKQPSELAKQHFDRCVLIKVYFAARYRNAYFGRVSQTTVEDPSGLALYSLTFSDIQRKIESRRNGGQGSSWTIFELPALAFMARERALVVYDLSTDPEPLAICKGPTPSSPLIADIAKALSNRGDLVLLFDVPNDRVGPAPLPFRRHTSFSSGSSRLLGWRPRHDDSDTADYLRIISRFVTKLIVWRQSFEREAEA